VAGSRGTAYSNSTRSQTINLPTSRSVAFALCIQFPRKHQLPYHSQRKQSPACCPHRTLECSQSKLVGEASPRCTCLQLLYRHFVQHHPCKTALHQEPHTASRRTSSIPQACARRHFGACIPSTTWRRENSKSTRSHSTASESDHSLLTRLEGANDSLLDAALSIL
jgi:hypothetical protein